MADTKISALSAASTLAGTEVLPVVQSSATVKATVAQILAGSQMVKIATSTLGSPAASIDFTSIAATWKDLRVVLVGRGDTAATNTTVLVRFNNDSGGNYDFQMLAVNNTATTPAATVAATSWMASQWIPAASADANRAGHTIIEILDYTGTAFYKTATARGNLSQSTGTPQQGWSLSTAAWRSTAAINRVTILPGAGNFDTGTTCQLYGVGV